MNPRGRKICGGIAVALVVLMLWLFRSSPDYDFPGDDEVAAFTVECDPLLRSWGRTFDEPDASTINGLSFDGYDVTSGKPPEPSSAVPGGDAAIDLELMRFCDGARTARAGLLGLVAFPTALLGAAAVIRLPREIRIVRSVPATGPPSGSGSGSGTGSGSGE